MRPTSIHSVKRGAGVLLSASLLGTCVPAAAVASETVRLNASLTPDRLGASTTIGFGFDIAGPGGASPPPLTHVDLRLPPGIGYVTTTLGLAICQPGMLARQGPTGCSPNSRIGFGSASVEVPFGADREVETPSIEAFMGPPQDGNIVVVFYANGRSPVSAQVIFEGELVPGFGTTSGSLDNAVPLIAGVPEGPDVSIHSVHTTIGPQGLRYERRVHGKVVRFSPQGVSVPSTCPRGGFPFQAEFGFADGSSASATSAVPCPSRRR